MMPASSRASNPSTWADLHVMIVNDHPDSAEGLRELLEAKGARAWIAVDGSMACRSSPTLVDMEPGGTGLMILVTAEYEGRRVTGVLPVRPQLHDRVLKVCRSTGGGC